MMESASLADRIEKCERILKENAKSQVFAALAEALRLKGDLDQAFRVCRQGLRIHPQYGPGHLVMAKINFDRKMYDWAEQELRQAIELDGQTRLTEQLQVEILIAKGNFNEGEAAIKKLKASGANPLLIQDLEQRLSRQKKEFKRRQLEQPPLSGRMAAKAKVEQGAKATEPPPKLTLSEALDRLSALTHVHGVVCAHTNGTVVDHRGTLTEDAAEIAAFGVEMCRNAESEPALTYFGATRQVSVETQDKMIVILKLERFNLVLFCDRAINLGSMRLKADEIIDNM